jgi:hypothetical protein
MVRDDPVLLRRMADNLEAANLLLRAGRDTCVAGE